MTTTNSNGIVFLEETDPVVPFHTLINTLQTGTSAALTTVKSDVSNRLQAASVNLSGENNNPIPVSTAPGETAALVTLSFSLSVATRLLVFAQIHVEPGGNAAGEVRVKDNGSTIIARTWHSRSTSHQQWPSVTRFWDFAAGSHTVTLTGSLSVGSSGTSYDHSYLSVGAR